MAETVYALRFLGTGVALARSDDAGTPNALFWGWYGPGASASVVCTSITGDERHDHHLADDGDGGLMVGCYEHTYTVGGGAPAGPVVYSEWQHHWLGGLIGERTHELSNVCPSGNATIHDEQTFLNGLVSALTAGIYAPTTVSIRCDTGQRAQLQLSRKEIVSILTSPAFRDRLETVLPGRLREVDSGLKALEEEFADD